ncbi:DUF2971 domain-containing protein [Pectobacterium carotovorum]|uniref:DUF2971 domain-containing protein n=1 Tax=Pectobacterium TaxID=122277 RepID=UPI000D3F7BA7|nr:MULTISPECIES: DUF2971 domain-containing protein [Pectobacterium]MCA6969225.1 DUF2971 domain-containing protein [Pectobacterium carotovorum]POE18460.1 hypothetical protein BV923_21305 [Pectobacterium odoriferum]
MESVGYKKVSHALFDGMNSLFHYQPLSSEQHKTWLTETLLENKIYCSNPADFNDPWDMKPLVKQITNERDRSEFITYLRNGITEEKTARFVEENLNNHVWIDEFARDLVLGHWRTLETIFRVYCLTSKPDNLLMWSHYANNHRGICLEFDTKNAVFGSAWKVEYHDEYPYTLWDDNYDVMRTALTKAKCWAYEGEYRILPKTECVNNFLSHQLRVNSDNKLSFPSDALKSVIVGCKANYEEIFSFIRSIRPDLPVKRAIMQPNRYGLHIA